MANISDTRFACQVVNYMAATLDNKVYITSGYNQVCNATSSGCLGDRPETVPFSNNDLLVLDFTDSFTWDPRRIGTRIRVPYTLPDVRWGTLWGVGSKLYRFGGNREDFAAEQPQGGPVPKEITRPQIWGGVWEYDMGADSWTNTTQVTEWGGVVQPVGFGAAACGGGDVCYLLLGQPERPMEVQGALLAYDVRRRLWLDMAAVEGNMEAMSGARMMYIKSLDSLVVVGGTIFGSGRARPMRTIKLFYIPTKTWFTVEATASPDAPNSFPSSRLEFCAVAVSSPDASSHSIYIFGGINGTPGADINQSVPDVWVLTMPSFTWIRVGAAVVGRESLTCSLISNRYMLAFSGRPGRRFGTCDVESVDGVMWDVTALRWTGRYEHPPSTAGVPGYKVPEAIYSLIGGGEDGGATEVRDLGDERLQKIFADAVVTTKPGEPTASSSQTPKPTGAMQGAQESGSGAPVGAIVGGVLGGLAVLALVVGVWWWVKRRRTQGVQAEPVPVEVYGVRKMEMNAVQKHELPGVEPVAEMEGGPVVIVVNR